MEKPIILLDVDGVLNPLGNTNNLEWQFETIISDEESGSFNLSLSKGMGAALNSLGCQIKWLTTWARDVDHANTNISPALGWGRKPVCTLVMHAPFDPHFKVNSVKNALVFPGPPLIWIDDQAFYQMRESDVTKEDLDPNKRLLIINPDPQFGLQKKHISQISDFISKK